MHVAKLVNYNVHCIWHMILSHLPATSAGYKYLYEHRQGTLQDQHVFVAKAFKWPAAACGVAFQICTMTPYNTPYSQTIRTCTWKSKNRNMKKLYINKKRFSQLPKSHRGHHHSICE